MTVRTHFLLSKPVEGVGYHALYREQEVNHCPGCGQTQWLVGRISAECAHCETALPLADSTARGNHSRVHHAHAA